MVENTPFATKNYRLSPTQDDALRLEVTQSQEIPAKVQKSYKTTEQFLGKKFVELYGQELGLSREQIAYMQEARCHLMLPDMYQRFKNAWRAQQVFTRQAELNGVIYSAYRPKNAPSAIAQTDVSQDSSFVGGESFWHGGIPVYIIQPGYEEILVDPAYLHYRSIQQLPFPEGMPIEEQIVEQRERFARLLATRKFTEQGMHEKYHGLQDANMPAPLLEAQAYYLQQDFASRVTDIAGKPPSPCQEAVDYFGGLVERYGSDVHKLLMGNLANKTRKRTLLSKIKRELTPEKLDEIYPNMEWIRQPVNPGIPRKAIAKRSQQ